MEPLLKSVASDVHVEAGSKGALGDGGEDGLVGVHGGGVRGYFGSEGVS